MHPLRHRYIVLLDYLGDYRFELVVANKLNKKAREKLLNPEIKLNQNFNLTHPTLANLVAHASQLCSNISPCGSTNLTPLSGSGLCEAVIITPMAAAIAMTNQHVKKEIN